MKRGKNRVAIIGCGNVGAASAYRLILSGATSEIVLLDTNKELAEGEAMDLQHAASLEGTVRVWAGNYDDAASADIAVIAAGERSKPNESRLDLLERNVSVVRDCVSSLKRVGFKGIILITTNPVDVLTQVAQKESDLPERKVIGTGTLLDTARLTSVLSEKLRVQPLSIHAYMIGEHGDSQIAAWSSAQIGGIKLREFSNESKSLDYEKVLQTVRRAAPEIVARKGYTSYGISTSIEIICKTILLDEKKVIPVSVMTKGEHGIAGVCLSLPCVIGSEGVERIVEIPLDKSELEGLKASANILLRKFQTVDDTGKTKPVAQKSVDLQLNRIQTKHRVHRSLL